VYYSNCRTAVPVFNTKMQLSA